jgi:hypothetical protein
VPPDGAYIVYQTAGVRADRPRLAAGLAGQHRHGI